MKRHPRPARPTPHTEPLPSPPVCALQEPGKKTVRFGIPPAAVSRLDLTIPEQDVRVDVQPSLAVERTTTAPDATEATQVQAFLGNASAVAIWTAAKDAKEGRTLPVPRHLRDAHYKGAERLDHGQDYQYAHDAPDGIVAQDYLGVDKTYYTPTDRGHEIQMAKHLEKFEKLRRDATA